MSLGLIIWADIQKVEPRIMKRMMAWELKGAKADLSLPEKLKLLNKMTNTKCYLTFKDKMLGNLPSVSDLDL